MMTSNTDTISMSLGRMHEKMGREDWRDLCADRGIDPVGFGDEEEIAIRRDEATRYGIDRYFPGA